MPASTPELTQAVSTTEAAVVSGLPGIDSRTLSTEPIRARKRHIPRRPPDPPRGGRQRWREFVTRSQGPAISEHRHRNLRRWPPPGPANPGKRRRWGADMCAARVRVVVAVLVTGFLGSGLSVSMQDSALANVVTPAARSASPAPTPTATATATPASPAPPLPLPPRPRPGQPRPRPHSHSHRDRDPGQPRPHSHSHRDRDPGQPRPHSHSHRDRDPGQPRRHSHSHRDRDPGQPRRHSHSHRDRDRDPGQPAHRDAGAAASGVGIAAGPVFCSGSLAGVRVLAAGPDPAGDRVRLCPSGSRGRGGGGPRAYR